MAEETLETAFEATSSPCDSNNVTEFSDLPPIRVTIGDCSTDVMFRVSDQGGGIAKGLFACSLRAHLSNIPVQISLTASGAFSTLQRGT